MTNTRPTSSVVTDDGLVERVAEAIWEQWGQYEIRVYKEQMPDIARAALAASDRDVLVTENARLREALGMFVSTAVITPETHRVSSDEWVLSKARAALIALAEEPK